MTLSYGSGPLSKSRAGRFSVPLTGDIAYVEPHPRRVQAFIGDKAVIDTEQVLMVHRPGYHLTYAFRVADVGDLPHREVPEAPGYVRVPWDAVDAWFEEGRKLVHYPPNPYHRVDCRPTKRRLRVEVAGTVLVDTDDAIILFETSLLPRLYVHKDHVRTDLLRPSTTWTYCNYKGDCSYWTAVVDGVEHEDVAWSYEEALPESLQIRGFLSFDPDKCEMVADLPDEGSFEP